MIYTASAYRRLKHLSYVAQRQLKCFKPYLCHLKKLVGKIALPFMLKYISYILRLLLRRRNGLVKICRLAVYTTVDIVAYLFIYLDIHYLHCLHHSAHKGQHIGYLFALFYVEKTAPSA